MLFVHFRLLVDDWVMCGVLIDHLKWQFWIQSG